MVAGPCIDTPLETGWQFTGLEQIPEGEVLFRKPRWLRHECVGDVFKLEFLDSAVCQ